MSDRASSELLGADRATRAGLRVPVAAALAVCVNPLIALANQGVLYATTSWMCAAGHRGFAFAVPIVSLALVAALTGGAYRSRRSARDGNERTTSAPGRFLASLGTALGVIAAALIVAQWVAALVFPPCAAI